MFEAAALLGICDKIVPGLLIGALRFGHLPTILVPAGPMPVGPGQQGEAAASGQLYAEGQGEPRGTARGRGGELSQPRHLHLLRHRRTATR
jgi:dihydroxyacid dehydratase/phosphogluconate dehydratase